MQPVAKTVHRLPLARSPRPRRPGNHSRFSDLPRRLTRIEQLRLLRIGRSSIVRETGRPVGPQVQVRRFARRARACLRVRHTPIGLRSSPRRDSRWVPEARSCRTAGDLRRQVPRVRAVGRAVRPMAAEACPARRPMGMAASTTTAGRAAKVVSPTAANPTATAAQGVMAPRAVRPSAGEDGWIPTAMGRAGRVTCIRIGRPTSDRTAGRTPRSAIDRAWASASM